MVENSTIELARKLNAIVTMYCLDANNKAECHLQKQPFDYLLVLDFEATCWEKSDKSKGLNEIIEFPCILYDLKHRKILEEFQQYVKPVENPKLSSFCTQLTGIQQNQVDNGVPLASCLMLYSKWLNDLLIKYRISLSNSIAGIGFKLCAFATWSDWDLGTCLYNECSRKRIPRNQMFSKWIDIRAIYKEHYLRRPKGLCGALTEVGLDFEGQEHCGLHDARNTAKLVGKIVADGALLRITKEIS